jgi:hypothetical protein
MADPPSFKSYNRLSANVHQIPGSPGLNASANPEDPDLIIISTWMGAQPRYIAKYLSVYQTLYPGIEKILITNEPPDILYRSADTQRKRLAPVLDIITATQQTAGDRKARILLHLFSNGGSLQVVLLAKAYKAQHNVPLPVMGVIIDSAPGNDAYWPAFRAFTAGAPQFFVLRWFFMAVVHVILFGYYARKYIVRGKSVIEKLRGDLNDKTLFPTDAKRTYVYSKEDQLVGWKGIEEHAAEGKAKGYHVDLELFEKSRHVGHLVANPGRYETIVKQFST